MTNPPYRRHGVVFRAYFSLDIASGAFAVEYPDLPGCVASGAGFVHARDSAKRALDRWIDASLDRGEAVPPPPQCQPRRDPRAVWIAARSEFEQGRIPLTLQAPPTPGR
jgi:predicted RNase H-like HicB family nuclease